MHRRSSAIAALPLAAPWIYIFADLLILYSFYCIKAITIYFYDSFRGGVID